MKIKLPKLFNQLDPQWKDKKFGTSATIGQYGCLVSCVAMICQYYGKVETPATLVDKVKFSGNLWIWKELERVYPDITYQGLINTPDPLTKQQMDFIRGKIDEGYPVLLQIDSIPTTSKLDEHWVLAIDYNGDDFIIANPWGGIVQPITSYGEKPQKIIYAYSWYKGKPVISKDNYYKGIDLNNLDSVKVCIDTWHDVAVNNLYIKKENHERIINEKEATIQNLNQQINQLNANLSQALKEKDELQKQLKDCQDNLNENEALNKKIQEITDLYNTLQVDYKNEKTNWQLKEADYIRKITILEKKYQATKSSIKKLLIDYIFKNG